MDDNESSPGAPRRLHLGQRNWHTLHLLPRGKRLTPGLEAEDGAPVALAPRALTCTACCGLSLSICALFAGSRSDGTHHCGR